MAYSIGPKIGIDGEREFRNQIKNINTEYKALEAETKALTAAFEANGDEQAKLNGTARVLEQQIDSQKRKMKLLEDAVEKASRQYGENSVEAIRLRGALYDTEATLTGLEGELRDTIQQLLRSSDAMEDLEDSTKKASESALSFKDIFSANLIADVAQDALYEVADTMAEFAKGMPEAAAEVSAANSQFEQTFGELENTAKSTLQAISDDTKIAATRMQGNFSKLFAFTKSVGGSSEEAMDIAGRAMRAAADNAAYYDKSIEEATEQLQSFLKGNYENDAALGIAATETSRNTKANELYAKSFKDLSEAQKVDVLLAMVEAGNEASGALGQATREADSWTNVQGELNEAMKQFQATLGRPVLKAVIPIIQGITDAIYGLIEQSNWKKLSSKIDEFTDAMAAADAQFEVSRSEIESNAYMAQRYVDRLHELEAAGLATEAAQREYANVVAHLNELYPELNIKIDENTGLVNQNSDAILKNIETAKQKALYEAMEEQYTSVLKAQAEATIAVKDAEYELVEIQEQRRVAEEQLAGITDKTADQLIKLYNAQVMCNSSIGGGTYAAAGQAAELAVMGEKLETLTQEEMKQAALLARLQGEETMLANTIARGNAEISNYDGKIQSLNETLQSFSAETENTKAVQDSLTVKIQEVESNLAMLTEEYSNAKAEAKESLESQIGLFDQLSIESAMSASEIIANWQSQQQAFSDYAANLQKASDMKLDQALIDQLSDGSAESMAILNELVNDTETNIEEINKAFQDRMNAEELITDAMAEARTGAQKEMDALVEDAAAWGIHIVDGAVDSIDENAHRFSAAMGRMASAGERSFRSVMMIRSPSKRLYEDNEFVVDGAVLSIEDNIVKYEAAMRDLGESGYKAYLNKRIALAEEYPSMMDSVFMETKNQASPSVNYGGFHIEIYQQPGEDSTDLAHRVMDAIQTEMEQKEVAFVAYN